MSIDFSNMNQRHLFLAYAIVLGVHFGYAGWIAANLWKLKRIQKMPQPPRL